MCPHVQAGEGRVYHCLTQNKEKVSDPCQEQLSRRQAIASQDYRADASLVNSCKEELEEFKCRGEEHEDATVKLSVVLLCLEDNLRDGRKVGGKCVEEMRQIRRSLMEDFALTPELVTSCTREIATFCKEKEGDQEHGQTIHCLMKNAMDKDKTWQSNESKSKGEFGTSCKNALNSLLAEAQVASDWKADPVLEDACEEVVLAACDPTQGGDAVMSCLMEQLAKGAPSMNAECSDVLMQIHYFLAREVLVDEHLYKACHKDAESVCSAKPGWHRTGEDSRHILVFPCLVRNLYADDEDDDDDEDGEGERKIKELLSEECTGEIERTLRQRAMSVQLHPEVRQNNSKYCFHLH